MRALSPQNIFKATRILAVVAAVMWLLMAGLSAQASQPSPIVASIVTVQHGEAEAEAEAKEAEAEAEAKEAEAEAEAKEAEAEAQEAEAEAQEAEAEAQEKGGEGCTPGFWKQPHHFDSWVGYSPDQTVESVFGDLPGVSSSLTLLQALESGGGGSTALLRHAVAALLNASNPNVNFDLSVAEVIAVVQQAFATGNFEDAKNLLASLNEQGCPLS